MRAAALPSATSCAHGRLCCRLQPWRARLAAASPAVPSTRQSASSSRLTTFPSVQGCGVTAAAGNKQQQQRRQRQQMWRQHAQQQERPQPPREQLHSSAAAAAAAPGEAEPSSAQSGASTLNGSGSTINLGAASVPPPPPLSAYQSVALPRGASPEGVLNASAALRQRLQQRQQRREQWLQQLQAGRQRKGKGRAMSGRSAAGALAPQAVVAPATISDARVGPVRLSDPQQDPLQQRQQQQQQQKAGGKPLPRGRYGQQLRLLEDQRTAHAAQVAAGLAGIDRASLPPVQLDLHGWPVAPPAPQDPAALLALLQALPPPRRRRLAVFKAGGYILSDLESMLETYGLAHQLRVTTLIRKAHCVVAKARWDLDGRRVNLKQHRAAAVKRRVPFLLLQRLCPLELVGAVRLLLIKRGVLRPAQGEPWPRALGEPRSGDGGGRAAAGGGTVAPGGDGAWAEEEGIESESDDDDYDER